MIKKLPLPLLFFAIVLFYSQTGYALVSASAGAGIEHFSWKEFDSTGQQVLEEMGYRAVFRLHLNQVRNDQFLLGYSGKLYGGIVNYNGETQDVPHIPVNTDTRYLGLQNEGLIARRYTLASGLLLDLNAGLGWDFWRRNIRNPFSDSYQIESYSIFYLKAGPGLSYPFGHNQSISIDFGGKLPFYTFENAYLNTLGYDQNPLLHPGLRGSLYLNAGYRINNDFEILAEYDTYRFVQSQQELVSKNGLLYLVFQPESSMDLIGIQIRYRIP